MSSATAFWMSFAGRTFHDLVSHLAFKPTEVEILSKTLGIEDSTVDTTPTCSRSDAHFSRVHITVHKSHIDPHFAKTVTLALAQGKRNLCRAYL